jgi:hypothetical protein
LFGGAPSNPVKPTKGKTHQCKAIEITKSQGNPNPVSNNVFDGLVLVNKLLL